MSEDSYKRVKVSQEKYEALLSEVEQLQKDNKAKQEVIDRLVDATEITLEKRDIVARFIMDKFNNTSKTGHFWFDIHDAADLLESLNNSTGEDDG